MISKNFLLVAPITALLCTGLAAQESKDFRFGLQGSIVMPTSMKIELKDYNLESKKLGDTGAGFSVFFQRGFNDKHAMRTRLEAQVFGEKDHGYGEKTSTSILSIMGDYLYAFDSHDKGFYALAGAGFVNTKIEFKEPGYSDSESASSLAVAGGFGYNFTTNMGIEIKWTKPIGLKYKDSDGDKWDANWDWITASFTYRF